MESYLAITAAEMDACTVLPENIAWMACHFSAYGTGLSNFPDGLPPGSILIVNDRTPICGHDPVKITDQLLQALEDLALYGILLDFQRPEDPESADLVKHLAKHLRCPLAVSEHYAQDADTAVFLSVPALNVPLDLYLKPWQKRKIWLEAAMPTQRFTIDKGGCKKAYITQQQMQYPHYDSDLQCHYAIAVSPEQAIFTLTRYPEDLQAHLAQAQALGVQATVGLYQELKNINTELQGSSV